MIKNIINLFLRGTRAILFFPFHILNKLSSIYSKLLNFIDPNGAECYWEELSQKQIDSRINSTLRYKNLDQHKSNIFDYKKGLNFYTPTKIASYRAHTLLSKEKKTLEWIDKHGGKNKTFFDIGANVGVYSLYYAAAHRSSVYSFEPAFRNLDLLVKNVQLNNLTEYISVISNPVYNKETFNKFSKSENTAGLAEATFGEKNQKIYYYNTLSISLDQLMKESIAKTPNLIKIDVDGNEIEVINGAKKIISSEECFSILVEIRPATNEIIRKILEKHGYKKDTEIDLDYQSEINQIWFKK